MPKKNKQSHYLDHGTHQDGLPHDDAHHSNLDDDHHIITQDTSKKHQHTHSHALQLRSTNSKVLAFCLFVTFSFAIVEALGGYFTHSVALQSDAVHMLTDAAGLLIAYLANSISKRPATVNLTFGYGKAEAIGALINCIFTVLLTLALLVEIILRFITPVTVHGQGLFIIASIGFVVNAIIAAVLIKYTHSLNIKAAFIHTLGDLLASFVAIIAGGVIYFTGINLVDPILSLIVIAILFVSNYRLIKQSLVVLMAGVPSDLDYEEVGNALKAIAGIVNVHDLHIWYMSSNKAALSAHIIAANPLIWQDILYQSQHMLLERFNIEHVTLQHEFRHSGGHSNCLTT